MLYIKKEDITPPHKKNFIRKWIKQNHYVKVWLSIIFEV